MHAPAPPAVPIRIILPHRERFGPASAGAVAMVVRGLAGAGRHPVEVIGPATEGETFPGIAFRPVLVPRYLPLTPTQSYAVALRRVLKGLPGGPIEVHNKPDVALSLARAFPDRPVSLFLHNDPRTMRGARTPAARQHLLRALARIVTVSDWLRRALLDGLAAPPDRSPLVIHNALDLAALPPPAPAEAREQLILFAGRVVPDKAPDAFVAACAEALAILPGWRAEIIGGSGFAADEPDTPFIRALRPRAEAAGVRLVGKRPHEAVLARMAEAAIVVVPSRWEEPFGLTALEAMGCGAALMSSGRGGLAEIGGDAALLFDPDDPAASGHALAQLAADPDRRAALAAKGLRRAREQFDLRDAIARLDALRDEIAPLRDLSPERRGGTTVAERASGTRA